MAYIAEKDTYAMAPLGFGLESRRLVKAGDPVPYGCQPVDMDVIHDTDAPVKEKAREARGDKEHSESHAAHAKTPRRATRAGKDAGDSGKDAD
jgi:hypothetical protein